MKKTVILLCTFVAVSLMVPMATAQVESGSTFWDDNGNVHEGAIEAIAIAGITRGCNPPVNDRYCPSRSVTRAEMAAFLVRALDLGPTGRDYFDDDSGSEFQDDINSLAAAGITAGCNPPDNDRYCPHDTVTRGQMAAFLVRGYGFPATGDTDRFVDDDWSEFEESIDRLAAAGITMGCNPPSNTRYCPNSPVRRDEMATFLARAENLPIVTIVVPPNNCSIFPADNIWNTKVDDLPLDPNSSAYINSMGSSDTLHHYFGSGVWPPGSTSPIGIPYVEVGASQPDVEIEYGSWWRESDPGPWPIPADAPIEDGDDGYLDRHVLVIDRDDCMLYELYRAFPQSDGSWRADSGAEYNLNSHELRPAGWTSADAAGLPIYPGLVTYDEVASGVIDHALRLTAGQTQGEYVWPARHYSQNNSGDHLPPMGQRFRLKADFDISGFSPQIQVMLTAMKEYGLMIADNGPTWSISGAPDERWDNSVLRELNNVPGSAFEAVDVSSLMIDPNSGRARQ